MAILRNFTTNIKVIETVVQLLSIPFVLGLSSETIIRLKAVSSNQSLVFTMKIDYFGNQKLNVTLFCQGLCGN